MVSTVQESGPKVDSKARAEEVSTAEETVPVGTVVKLTKRGQVLFCVIQMTAGSGQASSTEQLLIEASSFESVGAYAAARATAQIGTVVEAVGTRCLSRSGVPSIMVSALRALPQDDPSADGVADASEEPVVLYDSGAYLATSKSPGMPMSVLSDKVGGLIPVCCLDQDASGVVVFARSEEAASLLWAQMGDSNYVSNEYVALVRGEPQREFWSVNASLTEVCEDKAQNRGVNKFPDAQVKRSAMTSFWLVKVLPTSRVSLIRCRIDVLGGMHQIRRHLQSSGHNVIGAVADFMAMAS
ncbi:unnamed protein product [Prorocentrum cordatum]|uniref:Pseudouridine synthase RsuA/RluA-like domain-containing protein n=1 Tax=Prorocentrum cordatum TaxID=2364126 RepID=A0ABN9UKV2_9DINO|nr:unnamed protein product [Polarella glacialis]